jgi:hypothetical protein
MYSVRYYCATVSKIEMEKDTELYLPNIRRNEQSGNISRVVTDGQTWQVNKLIFISLLLRTHRGVLPRIGRDIS